MKCHGGCARENVEAILQARQLWPQPNARKRPKSDEEKRQSKTADIVEVIIPVPADAPPIDWSRFRREPPTALYEYQDRTGDPAAFVARWDTLTEGKVILPVSFARLKDGTREWVLRAPPGPHQLYNISALADYPDAEVLIVEGEKTAEAAARQFPEKPCLTWRGGAGSAGKSDFSPLMDRRVLLWPDADEAGHKAINEVAALLHTAGAAQIRLVELPGGLPKGWDLADPVPPGFDVLQAAAAARIVVIDEQVDAEQARPLASFVIAANDLLKMEIPPREWLIDRIISTSSLAMIYAERGLGKTWFVISMAISIAKGESFLDYEITRPWRVLYVDGEMSLVDIQSRIRALDPTVSERFLILPSEQLFREAKPLNLNDADDQKAIIEGLAALTQAGARPDLIIFDNLSSLSGGIDENDNSALDGLLRWLVKLKHEGFAILLVHHAGKSGAQRGASRREDLLDTSIALKAPGEDDEPHDGASFTLIFPKTRGPKPKPAILEMRLTEIEGLLTWAYNEPRKIDRTTQILRYIWESRPETQKDLARIAMCSEGSISQHCKKLRKAGYIEADGLSVTVTGREELVAAFPELRQQMLKQGDLPLSEVV